MVDCLGHRVRGGRELTPYLSLHFEPFFFLAAVGMILRIVIWSHGTHVWCPIDTKIWDLSYFIWTDFPLDPHAQTSVGTLSGLYPTIYQPYLCFSCWHHCLYLPYALSWLQYRSLWCVRWCTILLGRIMTLICLDTRVTRWAPFEGHCFFCRYTRAKTYSFHSMVVTFHLN